MNQLILCSTVLLVLLSSGAYTAPNVNAANLTFRQTKHLYLAQKALEVGDSNQAIHLIHQYEQQHPIDTPAPFYALLGRCYHVLDNHRQAATAFATALSLQPDSAEFSLNLATCHYLNGDFLQAGQQFSNTYRLKQPQDGELLYQAAIAYVQGDDYPHAQQRLAQLISDSNTIKQAWQELLLTCQIEQKQWPQAQQLLRTLLEQDPHHLPYWRLQTQLHLHQQAYAKAASSMEVMLRLQPPSDSELRQLAEVYRYLQAPLRCGQLLEQLHGEAVTAKQQHEIATLYQQGFDYSHALTLVRKGLQQWPNDPALSTLHAQLLYTQRNYQQLIELPSFDQQTTGQQQILKGYAAWHLGLWEKAQTNFRLATSDQQYRTQAKNALEVLELLVHEQDEIRQSAI